VEKEKVTYDCVTEGDKRGRIDRSETMTSSDWRERRRNERGLKYSGHGCCAVSVCSRCYALTLKFDFIVGVVAKRAEPAGDPFDLPYGAGQVEVFSPVS
jgi:hypothetical protein